MARRKIREYDSKRLLKQHIARLAGLNLPINVVQVTANTSFPDLLAENAWLNSTRLVVKPDCLFGKRCGRVCPCPLQSHHSSCHRPTTTGRYQLLFNCCKMSPD